MKIPYKILGIGFIVLYTVLAFEYPSQQNPIFQKILSKLAFYSKNEGPEKTYLHTDKDFYTSGETIWFKTYLVDGITHNTSDKSKVVYVELVNGRDSVIERRKLFVDAFGASGDIKIGNKIKEGDYWLRSYTKYMLNDEEPVFFQKSIPIFVQESGLDSRSGAPQPASSSKNISKIKANSNIPAGKPNMQFYPEGGHIVEGLPTTIGLEVTDHHGNGIAMKGVIMDAESNTVASFECLKFGLGSVGFTPLPNKQYFASAQIDNQEIKYPLPAILPKGYALNIKNMGDNILVQVASNTDDGLEGTLLIGHLRGDLIFKRLGETHGENTYAARLLTKELQDGVAQFTLFSPNGEPMCERLIYVDNPNNEAKLTISSKAQSYGPRDKVSLDLEVTDVNGRPLKGYFPWEWLPKALIRILRT